METQPDPAVPISGRHIPIMVTDSGETFVDLSHLYHLPVIAIADALGVPRSTMHKRVNSVNGRWPYRQVTRINRAVAIIVANMNVTTDPILREMYDDKLNQLMKERDSLTVRILVPIDPKYIRRLLGTQ